MCRNIAYRNLLRAIHVSYSLEKCVKTNKCAIYFTYTYKDYCEQPVAIEVLHSI